MNSKSKLVGRWMSWNEIAPYKEQLIDMECELMHVYHYPDRVIPRSYAEGAVNRLKDHLASGNTFFWGVEDGKELLGYYWGYAAPFIDTLRWHLRSIFFKDYIRTKGLGKAAILAGLEKAKEIGCKDAATEYVPFNEKMAALVKTCGYSVSRIEVVAEL